MNYLERSWPTRLVAGWLLCAWLAPLSAGEPEALGASEASLLDYAESHSPQLAVMALEYEAARARADAVGRFEDPTVEIELRDIERNAFSLSPSAAGSTRYLVSQSLPFFGKRDLEQRIARSEAERAGALRIDTRRDVRQRIGAAYASYWSAGRSLQVLSELAQTLDALEALARARYASGLAPQQDVLKAAVERSELARRRSTFEAMQLESSAAINAALARAPDAALAPPRSPPPAATLPSLEELHQRLRSEHPALAAERATVDSARLSEQLIHRGRYPDLTLGVAPIQRGSALEAWDVMLGFTLPLQVGRRRAQERAAHFTQLAAEARRNALETDLAGSLGASWARWQAAEHQRKLLRDTLLPLAQANYRSAVASYQLGSVDFTTLLEALREWRGSELDLIEMELDARLGVLQIERLAGGPP
ncbi:MAG: TolC family protein [Steroidobacteraceae bacterium]